MLCKITHRSTYALTILRLILGAIFMAHGAQKVFGLFGGPGLQGFVQYTTSLGTPVLLGYLAAFCEFIGGIMLFFGIAAEVGALLVLPVMMGAIVLVHWHNGFFVQNGGFEYPLMLSGLLIAIIIGGPGYWALWTHPCHLFGCNCHS